MEKVIFRTEKNRYIDGMSYLAVYPAVSANPGCFAARPFHFERNWRGEEKTVFEPFCELSQDYYYGKTRIVHKADPVIEKLRSAIEQFDDEQYQVCEKMVF